VKDLQADEETRGIRIVVLTAHDEPREVAEAQRLGVAGFLAKPIDMNRIMEKIRSVLGQGAAAVRKD